MADQPLKILIIGAHPDDADIKAGGTAAKWSALGHVVRLVSLTDGRAGHQTVHGPVLAQRRQAEAAAAAASISATYEIFDIPDGELDDRLEYRHRVIRLIRGFQPDLIITHRSTDYHPDHRFTGLLVQDASYLLTVPAVCPDTPHLAQCPVILYFSDAFKKPCRFEPHIAVDIEGEFDRLVGMLHRHQSQFYEWLPYNAGIPDQVPASDVERKDWLAGRMRDRIRPLADRFRDLVVRTYGEKAGGRIDLIEAFEVSEYGAPLNAEAGAKLFPFLPATWVASLSDSRKEWADVPEAEVIKPKAVKPKVVKAKAPEVETTEVEATEASGTSGNEPPWLGKNLFN
ncbi:N-acetylglucosaminyl deacetylase, LmbE family [Singulisphaera sp. GP187]|uniref:PIG-L deacetylase family protein n=1 Tax=Singulisphaera sp. GP187 TaxID=1882752 RepID=UPI00092C8342|nr:PIG-L family deacetylase [Singulisphaera sp. GP187]SIO29105.1 N-acetylglucosaminyl deacetylase, LmbE family [Singulisphaera sp. GP187]